MGNTKQRPRSFPRPTVVEAQRPLLLNQTCQSVLQQVLLESFKQALDSGAIKIALSVFAEDHNLGQDWGLTADYIKFVPVGNAQWRLEVKAPRIKITPPEPESKDEEERKVVETTGKRRPLPRELDEITEPLPLNRAQRRANGRRPVPEAPPAQ